MEHRATEAAEQAAAMITAAGMPRMPARVLMALVAAPAGGYTAAELAERLDVSAAAVSGAVRYLQDAHFARRLPSAGRRDRYDLVAESFHSVVIGNLPVYLRMADYVERIAAEAGDEPAVTERADEMSGFLRFMAERMPQLVDEWMAQREATGR